MECVLDTSTEDSEGAPTASQPSYEWRPPTRDHGALERRLARMEDNVASILETMKTVVDLVHNQKVRSRYSFIKNTVKPVLSGPLIKRTPALVKTNFSSLIFCKMNLY